MLNCPSPSLATGRSAPACSDIPVSPAGDDARTPGEWTPIRAVPGMA